MTTTKKQSTALVSFSGGQDSTSLLFWAKNRFDHVEAISFNYGQQHSVELIQGEKICNKLGIKRTVVDISFLKDICDSALTTTEGNVNVAHGRLKDLPASFVPNRNLILLSLANTYAQKVGIDNLITGTCQTDSSGYPDCRRLFIDSLESSLYAAASKTLVSVDYIRYILSIHNTTYGPFNKDSTPTITIDEGIEALEEINNFFGNIGSFNLKKGDLVFAGYEACSYIYNLISESNYGRDMLSRDDYSEFVKAYSNGLKAVNPHSVSPDESNYFLRIHTPLMYINKAETFLLAEQEGGLDVVINDSMTCYKGDVSKMHSWGTGCGECPACVLRKRGYEGYLELKKNV